MNANDLILARIMEIRALKSKSVNAFAEMIGMPQATVNNYMLGKRKVSLEFIMTIVSSFEDISTDWLLRGKGPMLITAARGSAPATFTTHNDFSNRDGDQVQGDKIEVSGSGNSIKPQSPDPSTTIEALLKLNADLVSLIKSQQ